MKKNNKDIDKGKMDEALFEYIQPQGGITFKEPNYIISGTGYIKVLHIYGLPPGLNDYWLSNICNIDGTIATVDIATKDSIEVKKNINKALKEEYSRAAHATDFIELYNARERQKKLQFMFDEIQSMGEVVKMLHFRIFLSGRSLADLEEQEDKLLRALESDQFLGAVLLSEGKREWQSLFRPYKRQQEEMFSIKASHLMTEQIAGGNPFHYSDLDDQRGTLLGFTPCGGPVIFDEFNKTESRKHYNSLVVGVMGSGKSTLLKKRFRARAERGDFIRCFDVTSEFRAITHEFGGKVISCDGKEGILNPLEILRSGDDDFTSFANHIAKVSTFYKCFNPGSGDDQITHLQNALRKFYTAKNLVPGNPVSITGRPASEYPVLSDFLSYLENRMKELLGQKTKGLEEALVKSELMQTKSLSESVYNMVENYGRIFDGHSSIDNIVDEQVVTFDISSIKDLGNIFVAQLFNMVSLCFDNCIANGSIMKDKYENGEIALDDVTRFMIIIDESHRWVNAKMPMILERIIVYLREARKYFGGIMLASQSLRDYVPEGSKSENLDLIKTVFE
ncbi:MAG: VirB4 family type IV secretion system protein, partial [Anaerovoracaceae bacterium]